MKLQLNTNYLALALIIFLMESAIVIFLKSGFIRYTFGDFLVVILLFAIIRGCTNLSVRASALVVLIIAYTIEFLQLTPFLYCLNLKNSFIAKLILGSTFQFTDLTAYTLGIFTVLIVEALLKNSQIFKN